MAYLKASFIDIYKDFVEKVVEMKQGFLERGYIAQCVDEAYYIALSKSRADLLKNCVKKERHFSVSCITLNS